MALLLGAGAPKIKQQQRTLSSGYGAIGIWIVQGLCGVLHGFDITRILEDHMETHVGIEMHAGFKYRMLCEVCIGTYTSNNVFLRSI